ncbi:MAG: hypothetical protein ACE14P_06285 [Methanotrichaceae archaeon]
MTTRDELPKALLDIMPPNASKEAASDIIGFLSQRSQASISEVSRGTGISYASARSHLERLVKANLALEEVHGMNRLFILKEID